MGSSLSSVWDEYAEYRGLAEWFAEPMRCSPGIGLPYGMDMSHLAELRRRAMRDCRSAQTNGS